MLHIKHYQVFYWNGWESTQKKFWENTNVILDHKEEQRTKYL